MVYVQVDDVVAEKRKVEVEKHVEVFAKKEVRSQAATVEDDDGQNTFLASATGVRPTKKSLVAEKTGKGDSQSKRKSVGFRIGR